jgi:hypothetical protein
MKKQHLIDLSHAFLRYSNRRECDSFQLIAPFDIGDNTKADSQSEAASGAIAEVSSNASTGAPHTFGDIERSGDEELDVEEFVMDNTGENLPIHTSDTKGDDSESSISEFDETSSEEEDTKDLPLYPLDTNDEAAADEDRRAFAIKFTKIDS